MDILIGGLPGLFFGILFVIIFIVLCVELHAQYSWHCMIVFSGIIACIGGQALLATAILAIYVVERIGFGSYCLGKCKPLVKRYYLHRHHLFHL